MDFDEENVYGHDSLWKTNVYIGNLWNPQNWSRRGKSRIPVTACKARILLNSYPRLFPLAQIKQDFFSEALAELRFPDNNNVTIFRCLKQSKHLEALPARGVVKQIGGPAEKKIHFQRQTNLERLKSGLIRRTHLLA